MKDRLIKVLEMANRLFKEFKDKDGNPMEKSDTRLVTLHWKKKEGEGYAYTDVRLLQPSNNITINGNDMGPLPYDNETENAEFLEKGIKIIMDNCPEDYELEEINYLGD